MSLTVNATATLTSGAVKASAASTLGNSSAKATGVAGLGTIKVYDYNNLQNHPKIEHVELVGDKSLQELGLTEITEEDAIKVADEAFDNVNKETTEGSNG